MEQRALRHSVGQAEAGKRCAVVRSGEIAVGGWRGRSGGRRRSGLADWIEVNMPRIAAFQESRYQ